jgi:hypothetical protein
MQVLVNGLTGDRHVIVCNGQRVPRRPTGKRAESVAGVRFNAGSPASGLHPTIPPQPTQPRAGSGRRLRQPGGARVSARDREPPASDQSRSRPEFALTGGQLGAPLQRGTEPKRAAKIAAISGLGRLDLLILPSAPNRGGYLSLH